MRRFLPAALFISLALLVAAPAFLPGRVMVPMDLPRDLLAWKGDPAVRIRVSNSLLSDVPLQLVPWDVESRRLLAAGEIPWRNRFAGAGEHLFANPLAALLSPFTWPRLLAGLDGWTWTVGLKLVVAGLGMYWLALVVGARRNEALLSGAVFALSGYATVWALYPHTNVFVLLPALAAAALRLARDPSPSRAVAVALLAALATAGGHPEGLFVGVLAIAVWLPFAGAPRKLPVAGAAAAGFLLVGVQLVPFAIVLARSWVIGARGEQLGLAFRKFSIPSLVLPGWLGSPLRGELDLTALFAGTENFNQRSGAFVGALVLAAIALGWRRLDRPFRVGVTIGSVFLALSFSIPGLAHLLHPIPLLGWTAAEYWAIGFVVFASLAAGPAVVRLTEQSASSAFPALAQASRFPSDSSEGPHLSEGGRNAHTRRRGVGLVLLVLGLLLAAGGALPALAPGALRSAARAGIDSLRARGHLRQAPEVYEERMAAYLDAARNTGLRRATLPGLAWAGFGAALLIPAGGRRSLLASGAAVAELLVFGWGYNPVIRTSEIAPEPEMLRAVRAADREGRWMVASSHEVFPPNLSTLWRVRDVHAYDVLVSREQVERLRPAGYEPLRWALPLVPSPEQSRVLASLGVRFYLTPGGIVELEGAVPQPPPANAPPDGLAAGLAVSAAGAALLVGVALTPTRWWRGVSTRRRKRRG